MTPATDLILLTSLSVYSQPSPTFMRSFMLISVSNPLNYRRSAKYVTHVLWNWVIWNVALSSYFYPKKKKKRLVSHKVITFSWEIFNRSASSSEKAEKRKLFRKETLAPFPAFTGVTQIVEDSPHKERKHYSKPTLLLQNHREHTEQNNVTEWHEV